MNSPPMVKLLAKPDGVVAFETQNWEAVVVHLTNHHALMGINPKAVNNGSSLEGFVVPSLQADLIFSRENRVSMFRTP